MPRLRAVARYASLGIIAIGCSAGAGAEGDEEPLSSRDLAIIGGAQATAYPEAAYLNIDMTPTGGSACSAALIAPRVVLTAGHCVDGHSRWEVHVGSVVALATSSATYDWDEDGARTVNPAHHDIGLVFLDRSIALRRYPTLARAPLPDGAIVVNVGRVNNGTPTNALYATQSRVVSGASVGFPFDYASSRVIHPGDSGGPDFAIGTHEIVSVNSGIGDAVEVLARVDLLRGWLQAQIAAHGGVMVMSGG